MDEETLDLICKVVAQGYEIIIRDNEFGFRDSKLAFCLRIESKHQNYHYTFSKKELEDKERTKEQIKMIFNRLVN